MSKKPRSVTVKFSPEMFEQIKAIAENRGETLSDTIRYLLARGLDERIFQQNTELLTKILREQIDQALADHSIYPDYTHDYSPKRRFNVVDPRRLTICRKTS